MVCSADLIYCRRNGFDWTLYISWRCTKKVKNHSKVTNHRSKLACNTQWYAARIWFTAAVTVLLTLPTIRPIITPDVIKLKIRESQFLLDAEVHCWNFTNTSHKISLFNQPLSVLVFFQRSVQLTIEPQSPVLWSTIDFKNVCKTWLILLK